MLRHIYICKSLYQLKSLGWRRVNSLFLLLLRGQKNTNKVLSFNIKQCSQTREHNFLNLPFSEWSLV